MKRGSEAWRDEARRRNTWPLYPRYSGDQTLHVTHALDEASGPFCSKHYAATANAFGGSNTRMLWRKLLHWLNVVVLHWQTCWMQECATIGEAMSPNDRADH